MKKFVLTAVAAGLMSSAAAFAQTTAPTAPSTTPPAATKPSPMSPSMTTPPSTTSPSATSPSTMSPSMTSPMGGATKSNLTDEQAKTWVDKVIYTADGKNVGEVGAFLRDSSGNVTELHADIGGLMGIGETRVRLMPDQFKLGTDRVTVSLTEEQIKALPKVTP